MTARSHSRSRRRQKRRQRALFHRWLARTGREHYRAPRKPTLTQAWEQDQ